MGCCVLVISKCPKTGSMAPDRFLYTQPELSRLCHSFLVMSCNIVNLPEEHRVDKIFEMPVKQMVLRDATTGELPGKLACWVSLLSSEEKPRF